MSNIKKVPQRQCIGCGEMKSKKEMTRVIRTNEGEMSVDSTGKKNGRGAYICNSVECLKKAVKNHGLDRAFKTSVPQEIYDELISSMEAQNAE